MHNEQKTGFESPVRPGWTLKQLSLCLSACFMAYLWVVFLILVLLNLDCSLPRFVEAIAASFGLASKPFFPLLDHLGLMEGEYWRLPSLVGYLLVVVIYLVLLNLPILIMVLYRKLAKIRHPLDSAAT